jgi:HSP20 family protein
MDVSESDSHFTISFDVPGATRDALKVSVEGRRVTLTTVAASAAEPTDKAAEPAVETRPAERTLYRERATPVFARTVALPVEVDQQASQAKFENGVLTLVLAKKVAAGATQLQIA